jgi:hypothetical protein
MPQTMVGLSTLFDALTWIHRLLLERLQQAAYLACEGDGNDLEDQDSVPAIVHGNQPEVSTTSRYKAATYDGPNLMVDGEVADCASRP